MPDGNNRIQVITINSSPLKTCLVNVYMTSLQGAGDLDYKDTMDQISEIIEKYKDSYQTIICGDMNASLHRDNRRRDQNLKEFMINNNLSLGNRYPTATTFFHHNGKKISQSSRESKNAHTLWKKKINSQQNAEQEKNNFTSKKRKLRQLRRQAYASKNEKFFNDVMQVSQKDSKTFHKLIKKQRSKLDINTDILYIGNQTFEGENILSAWQTHFETLGTPNFDENIFDLERLKLSKLQNKIISELDLQNKEITKATPTEIESVIRKLNTGKASDENRIVSEHYIHAIDIFETVINDRLEPELFPSQKTLQRGFTEGASSLFTAFIVSETTMLYKFLKIVSELLTLDAEKAFDTVNHEIMLNKMFHDGIGGDMWVLKTSTPI
ncbi:unnamed protein product [Mytilus coruscus]|uniref:Endonuclease/exonuclease/phosphatase domain-containing protein n=1 Tax=Mytilus coruscus TaxID=42192 RepID=A0A6J8CLH4_MYTCO|nr:unnamed protein product [Mytilus coruscus]